MSIFKDGFSPLETAKLGCGTSEIECTKSLRCACSTGGHLETNIRVSHHRSPRTLSFIISTKRECGSSKPRESLWPSSHDVDVEHAVGTAFRRPSFKISSG